MLHVFVAKRHSILRGVTLLVMLVSTILLTCADSQKTTNGQLSGSGAVPFADSPVVAEGAVVEQISTNHGFTEGPVVDAAGTLFFVDVPFNTIYQVTPDGEVSPFVSGSGCANGLGISPDGVLHACLNGDRSIVAVDSDGSYTTVADMYQGKRFNNPNDMWFDANGGFYFTDPAYYLNTTIEQDGQCVYYVTPDRSAVIRVIDDSVQPNGLIGTPDGTVLYVADPGQRIVFKYSINDDGTLSNKTVFSHNECDGMTIDSDGNLYFSDIYYTDGPGITVYNPDGELIESIAVPEGTSNCGFGGPDKKTLFITARTSVYKLQMKVAGL